jgi:hypothetical protein
MSAEPTSELDGNQLRQKINLETGRITWQELQRHFARGVVVVVANELDLVEVAARFSEDDRQSTETWISNGQVHRATDDDARRWDGQNTTFWASVVAPWVLIQEDLTP